MLEPVGGAAHLSILVITCIIAGIVRGFAGFGTALVIIPIASIFMRPIEAIIMTLILDAIGPLPVLPKAIPNALKAELKLLLPTAALGLPVGVFFLTTLPTVIIRGTISAVALLMIAALLLGVRYNGQITRKVIAATGAASGFLGGLVGLPGPPIMLFYMSRPVLAVNIRATVLLFFTGFDILSLLLFAILGHISIAIAGLGILMAAPAMIGAMIGNWLFVPKHEKFYRLVGYMIITVSAIIGLPILKG